MERDQPQREQYHDGELVALREALRDLDIESRNLAARLAAIESVVWKLSDRLQQRADSVKRR